MKKFRIKGYTKIALFILLISRNLLGSVNFKEHTENKEIKGIGEYLAKMINKTSGYNLIDL